MNERIRELSKQAWEWAEQQEYNDPAQEFSDILEQKFAELIVRECMTTVLKESAWYWDENEFESSNAIQNAARRLKEHFGVEE